MPFPRPTLAALLDQSASEMESRLPGVLARVRRSLAGILSRVLGAGLWGLYGYAEWQDRQKWPDLCEAEYLDWHGGRWNVTRKAAVAASGTVRFTGVNGTAIPQGTVVQRADGVQYATTAAGAIAAGEALIAAAAVLPGQAGNTQINTGVSLVTPIAGVNTAATTQTAMTGGADIETDERYRARILLRIRKPPHGGALHDYELWALEVPGVTRVWVSPLEPAEGDVTVRFVRDDDPTFIPDAPEVAAVQAYIDAVRPVTATTYVLAPAAQAIPFTIRLTPDTPETRAAVLEELTALERGDDNVPGGTALVSHFREAISVAPGETDHELIAPNADTGLPANTMWTVGPITWI